MPITPARNTRRTPPAGARSRAPRMEAEQRREQLLDAAEVAFAARGYRDAGTADVAAAARVSEPTIYRYFDSKRDLYLAMLDRNSRRLLDAWREIAANSVSPMAALDEIGRWYFTQLRRDPAPFRLRARSLLEIAGDERLTEHARRHFRETFEFVLSLYERARTAKEIGRDADPRARAWLFMAVGGLLDQFLLIDLDGIDGAELRRVMEVVRPPQRVPAHDGRKAPRRARSSHRGSKARPAASTGR
ncbi:MAG: TetR/AcrR family transcriptional regulator [Deltaproteobacteria bacterium]|nr:TetR/AcrR family transcriptional regulator [Deltaproteobacteria bacterium]